MPVLFCCDRRPALLRKAEWKIHSGKSNKEIFFIIHVPLFIRTTLRSKAGRRQSLSRSYGRFFAEFLNASSLVLLGLLDHPTGVGLRYGFIKLWEAMLFLEAQRFRLIRQRRIFGIHARLNLRIFLQISTPNVLHVQSIHTLWPSHSVPPPLE